MCVCMCTVNTIFSNQGYLHLVLDFIKIWCSESALCVFSLHTHGWRSYSEYTGVCTRQQSENMPNVISLVAY